MRGVLGIRVLVTGGRDYVDIEQAYAVLDGVNARSGISYLIHGAARGADTICGRWAQERGISSCACPANWERHGLAAGFRRNQAMLDGHRPDILIAFPGGAGTADMTTRAEKALLPVLRVPERAIPAPRQVYKPRTLKGL